MPAPPGGYPSVTAGGTQVVGGFQGRYNAWTMSPLHSYGLVNDLHVQQGAAGPRPGQAANPDAVMPSYRCWGAGFCHDLMACLTCSMRSPVEGAAPAPPPQQQQVQMQPQQPPPQQPPPAR